MWLGLVKVNQGITHPTATIQKSKHFIIVSDRLIGLGLRPHQPPHILNIIPAF